MMREWHKFLFPLFISINGHPLLSLFLPLSLMAMTQMLVLLCLVITVFSYEDIEMESLLEFKAGLRGSDHFLKSWDPTFVTPCNWFHVHCDNDHHVIRLDLGDLHLEGKLVPKLGNLTYLQYLHLYGNNLHGPIPKEIGKLTFLKELDLSSNHLTGSIPEELTKIRTLRFLNLSNNALSGHIPTMGCFQSFKEDSFEGNPKLCGDVVQRKCI